ncbi:hypothetical protein AB835_06100 [Candidatus Endobugula sertula]|uniref:Dihydrofolate synthase/folylpolyglutamate synthase n=1 Tax=Candidatus Endobugula sertula TaxID=62101 RepID=A0A1D2QR19_9GAMM|nr:hypothetical protein AB835_06100 [Candidatus Endobugula sertula]
MARFSILSDWLTWLESSHSTAIDLGLDRVYEVACRLQLLQPKTPISLDYSGALSINNTQVITVAGTNGKGSCVATLEQYLMAQYCSVGTYTSPHFHHYCERIQIDGKPVSEKEVCAAFAAVDDACGEISLTYFEFGTLAALWIFVQHQLPFVVLEVGLGGRLDAVNIVDADIAIVTAIAVDHEEWLGNDREQIAIEKLGISRVSKPVVIAETELTQSLQSFCQSHHPVYCIKREFMVNLESSSTWFWCPEKGKLAFELPVPILPLTSVAAALQALYISQRLPDEALIKLILRKLQLTGRYEQYQYQQRQLIFDVAHNPAAAKLLAQRLQQSQSVKGNKTVAVFAVMADKDFGLMLDYLTESIDRWYLGGLDMERAATVDRVSEWLIERQQPVTRLNTLDSAFDMALSETLEHDRIVIFGSFFTVAAIQQYLGSGLQI